MKLVNADNPVRSSWLSEQGFRLDPSPFLSGAYEAKKLLERLAVRKDPLHSLTHGYQGGIYNGPKFRRVYLTDPKHGVPFIGSTDMLEADFSWLPLLRRSDAEKLSFLRVDPGTTLISCSGTIGRMTYVRPDMADIWSSQHIMKVRPHPEKIHPGYLNAFLQSRYGVPIITSAAYGAIIQHIEPHHIAGLPVPRFDAEVENQIHHLIEQAAELRASFQAGVREATRDLFTSAGLSELVDYSWHKQPGATGFAVRDLSSTSLRALNYDGRIQALRRRTKQLDHESLGNICDDGELSRGNRFKRVDADEGSGFELVGQEQVFWSRPEPRHIALRDAEAARLRSDPETTLIASQGLLTDRSLIGRAAFISPEWQKRYVFSEHLLRVRPGPQSISGAYLFAYLRSEAAFRTMRSLCAGTGPQDINSTLRRRIPVPLCTSADRERIAETVRQAYRDRDEADRREDQALTLLDQAVREAAG
ncbi:type I restriction enzyme, S subunit [Micromonospora pallida]|uniref:Type I restriction enzyme, S subunit n=1 Tax=Micromonospora pallida TaxID=145854 RepID=A0A1C6TAH5_9ACTN|nr:restriction endonuclease subunit S [Micromonospora pallida]SCL38806.1 type I restriction enzyme, S subunit [Micromonospora pallida]